MNIQHVPAWKRLGLKLKQAGDTSAVVKLQSAFSSNDRKRKQGNAINGSHDPNNNQHQLKKPRTANTRLTPGLSRDIDDQRDGKLKTDSIKSKKSVAFTADTKAEDGDTARTIQFLDSGPSDRTSGEEALNIATESGKLSARSKRTKQANKKKLPKPTLRKASAALEYLDQFHKQRDSWKFSKNHETWLLKHALSTEDISQVYNLALASYIQGLKSVGARQRLAEQCRQSIKGEQTSVNDTEVRARVLQALEHELGDSADRTHADDELNLSELSRGRLILISLGEDLNPSVHDDVRSNHNTHSVKKNKSRTTRIEVESSSSSESESEISGSDEGDSDSETSSSGSSSDSDVST